MNKDFRIGDIFDKIEVNFYGKEKGYNGRRKAIKEAPDELYSIPVICAKKGNNGIKYWGRKDYFQAFANVISIVRDGAVATGRVYAHEYPTSILDNSYLIKCRVDVSFNVLLYMSQAIEKVIYQKYSRANKALWENKVENDYISLPIQIKDGQPVTDENLTYHNKGYIPDWDYMDKFIRHLKNEYVAGLEQKNKDTIEAYFKAANYKTVKLTKAEEVVLKENKLMKTFRLGDLFIKLQTRYLGKGNKFKAVSAVRNDIYNIPVVYAKCGDNGIMYWAKEGDFKTYENTISIIYNGAVAAGLVYAQEEQTGILAESYLVKLKNAAVSHDTNLYLASVMRKVIYPRYSRDKLATWKNKVENDFISLPVLTDDKNHIVYDKDCKFHKDGYIPDWNYMDRYIKVIKKLVISDKKEQQSKLLQILKSTVKEN